MILPGVRGGALGWGTVLNAGRSRVRFGIFHRTQSYRPQYGPAFETVPNGNKYQEYFLGDEGGRCLGLKIYHLHVPTVLKSGSLKLLKTAESVQVCPGIVLLVYFIVSLYTLFCVFRLTYAIFRMNQAQRKTTSNIS
jgi:hypothetical protein